MLKKTSLALFVLILGALAVSPQAWAGTLPESMIPEGARWIAHLDMEKFVSTQLFKLLETDGRLQIRDKDITRMLKLDLYKDVTGITAFGFGAGGKRAVFLAAGRFDKKRLLTLLELSDDLREIPYRENTIYASNDHEYGAFINAGLIVFGERREDVEKVLDTAAGKAKSFAASPLNANFKSVSAGSFLCGSFDDLAGFDKGFAESKLVGKAKGLFFLAQEKQDRLSVRLQVTADSPESAKDMADIAQGLLAMARLSQKQHSGEGLALLAKDAVVKQDGLTIRLELDLPSREAANLMSRGRGVAGLFD
jgi:hypothetical protein